jgi:5-methylcytosine-specific restriction endonuclease McrA
MTLPKPFRLRLPPKAYRKLCLEVFTLDDWRCKICHKMKPLSAHHLQKRSQGGSDVVENLLSVCVKCHDDVERHRITVEPVDMSKRIIRVKAA